MAVDAMLETLVGARAGADIASTDVYRFAALVTTAGTPPITVVKAAAVGAIGVLYSNPPAGEGVTVVVGGQAKVIAGAAIAIGANVDSDANGAAIVSAGSGKIALTEATAAGQIIEVLL